MLHLLMNLFSKCLVKRSQSLFGLFKNIILFVYLFFGCVLGLHCFRGLSLVGASGGSFLVVMCRLFVVVASLVAAHRLKRVGLSSRGVCAQQLRLLDSIEPRLSSCGLWA